MPGLNGSLMCITRGRGKIPGDKKGKISAAREGVGSEFLSAGMDRNLRDLSDRRWRALCLFSIRFLPPLFSISKKRWLVVKTSH